MDAKLIEQQVNDVAAQYSSEIGGLVNEINDLQTQMDSIKKDLADHQGTAMVATYQTQLAQKQNDLYPLVAKLRSEYATFKNKVDGLLNDLQVEMNMDVTMQDNPYEASYAQGEAQDLAHAKLVAVGKPGEWFPKLGLSLPGNITAGKSELMGNDGHAYWATMNANGTVTLYQVPVAVAP